MLNRRTFLKTSIGSAGLLPWLQSGIGSTPSTSDDVIVAIQFGGGLDMLSQWVPFGVPEYSARRGSTAYAAPNNLSAPIDRRCLVAEPTLGIGFGPGMTEIKQLYDRGDVAVVQKVGYPNPSRSHFTSLEIWRYGQRDLTMQAQDPRGWLARVADDVVATPSAVVAIGTPAFPEFESRDGNVVLLDSLDSLIASDADPSLQLMQESMDRVATHPEQTGSGPVWDAAKRAAALRADLARQLQGYDSTTPYPPSALAGSLREVSRLIRANNGTRAFFVTRKGASVDTHSNQFDRLATIRPEFDAALGAFIRDLQQNGTWGRVTIVLYTEFGRTLDSNGSGGTDHGHGNHVFVIGDAVRGGAKGNPITSADLSVANDYLPVEIDFREIFHEIALNRMQIDLNQSAFAETYPTTAGGLRLF